MSENFKIIKQVYEKAVSMGKFDAEELSRAIRPVAEAYSAAQITIEIPVKFGSREKFVLYGDDDPEINGNQVITFSGDHNAGGKTTIEWVCRSDHSWCEEEIDDIRHICRTACVLSEKIRLGVMVNNYYYLDTITGMSNMNGITRFSNHLIKRGIFDEYGFAFLNIVGFNYVNKKVGFNAGTKVIKYYAKKLREILDKDELLGRPGGDNFLIIFKKKNLDKIKKITDGIAIRIRVNSTTVKFNLSSRMGIYMVSAHDKQFDKVISYLSNCIDYAKNYSKTNVVFYTKDVEHRVIEHKEFCQKFKNAISSKEFFVVYQPKVFTKTNSLYGAEALVRWNSSGRLIYPGEFVEIFEKEHLISDLDFYVLEQVCINMRDWLDKGLDPVKISVNFSNDHLGDEDLVSRINEIVDKYGIEHSLIEIEMTETVDVNEINQLLSYVDGLHNNGFTVAIDDFGIGYSSLLMLQTISVDVLKIDKAFIAEVTGATGKRENIILRHIINMAEDLGVEIVAEGVETTDQLDNLNNMNCHRIQGYYFDKPLSADDYGKRLVQRCYAAVH